MAKTHRTRTKPCAVCRATPEALYRIRVEADGPWLFACDDCRAALAADNPHYVYGGTWKRRKRH